MAEKNPMPSRVFLTTAREEKERGTYKGEAESAASAWQ